MKTTSELQRTAMYVGLPQTNNTNRDSSAIIMFRSQRRAMPWAQWLPNLERSSLLRCLRSMLSLVSRQSYPMFSALQSTKMRERSGYLLVQPYVSRENLVCWSHCPTSHVADGTQNGTNMHGRVSKQSRSSASWTSWFRRRRRSSKTSTSYLNSWKRICTVS